MTSLEFIKKEIRELKFQINYIKSNMKKYIDFRTEGQLEIDMKQLKINHLQQIKSELEAWEVVKPYVDIIDKDTPYPFWQLKPNYDECKLKETNILIKAKALEVDK
jgi:hypothetical protein